MTLVRPISFGKYVKHVRGLFWTRYLPIVKPPASIKTAEGRDCLLLMVKVAFRDGSALEATEQLVEHKDGVNVVAYSYLYERQSGFFFQYEMERDKELTTVKRVWKPHRHLHVGAMKEIADCLEDFPPELREHDGPHFGTPFVTLEGVLAAIIVNYFCQDKDVLDKLDLNSC